VYIKNNMYNMKVVVLEYVHSITAFNELGCRVIVLLVSATSMSCPVGQATTLVPLGFLPPILSPDGCPNLAPSS
jgi:hypothetical protein